MVFPQLWRLGAIGREVACKCNPFSVITTALDPKITFTPNRYTTISNNDITVVTSNVFDGTNIEYQTSFTTNVPTKQSCPQGTITPNEAIADLGATQIFVMEGTPVLNKRITTCPLKVALADGRHVISTHMCDIILPGLPTTLVGHIVPELSMPPYSVYMSSQKQRAR
jgi:hypothetical protein